MSCAELNGTEGGRLLRYDLQSLMTSLKYPENTQISYMKGIIEEKRVKWSDYAPIVVDGDLPFYIKAKKGTPVSRQRILCDTHAFAPQRQYNRTMTGD